MNLSPKHRDNAPHSLRRFPSRHIAVALLAVTVTGIAAYVIQAGVGQDGIQSLTAAERPPRPPALAAFDLGDTSIPREQIHGGGPPKDGIPALSAPQFVAAAASGLLPDDRIIGVVMGREARAYPIRILNYHEIVNDRIAEIPIAVTYCPLCDSAAVFDRRTPVGEREFGVSGLLYNSNVLLYDRAGGKESLWSQMSTSGISGPGKNQQLSALPLELTSWRDWHQRHPETQVLSSKTGHVRDYSRSPYDGYARSPELMFPVDRRSAAWPLKTPVLGIWTNGAARAYPLAALGSDERTLVEALDGLEFTLEYNPQASALRVVKADVGVRWMYSCWFAWYAFRPETQVFRP